MHTCPTSPPSSSSFVMCGGESAKKKTTRFPNYATQHCEKWKKNHYLSWQILANKKEERKGDVLRRKKEFHNFSRAGMILFFLLQWRRCNQLFLSSPKLQSSLVMSGEMFSLSFSNLAPTSINHHFLNPRELSDLHFFLKGPDLITFTYIFFPGKWKRGKKDLSCFLFLRPKVFFNLPHKLVFNLS